MKILFGILLTTLTLLLTTCPGPANDSPQPSPAPNDAAPSALIGPTWGWMSTTSEEGVFASNGPARYTLRFNADGSYQARLDCNQMSGTYTLEDDGTLYLTLGPSTLIGCPPDSMDAIYTGYLQQASALRLTEDSLEIDLMDGSVMEFIQQ